jgi:chromosome segregation ATPase
MDENDPIEIGDGRSKGFWRKLSAWLQPWKRPTDPPDDALAVETPAIVRDTELAWPRRRASQISRLEEGFNKLANLVDAIDQHLQKQADRSDQLIAQTRRLADTVAQTSGISKQQAEAVEEMANQYRTQTRQMQQVAEAVEALPRAIKHQSEQLGQIHGQLEAQLEAELSAAQGIQKLAGASDVVRNLADEQRRQFQMMQESSQSASMQLAEALDQQNRRFSWLIGFLIGTALLSVAASATSIVLLLRLWR